MSRSPVSAFNKLGGLVFLPRTLDKIRMHARGELGPDYLEYLSKGFDGRLCHFLGLDYEALKTRTLAGGTDEEIWAWIQQRIRPLTDIDLMVWNGFAPKRGWRDDATVNLEKHKAAAGLSHRTDIVTFFDFYEVDEGRAP